MRLRWISAVLAVLVLGYTALWFAVAETVEERLRTTLETLSAEGLSVASGRIARSGFPDRVVLTLDGGTLEGGVDGDGLAAGAEQLALEIRVWSPDRMTGDLRALTMRVGRHRLLIPEAALELASAGKGVRLAGRSPAARLEHGGATGAAIAGLSLKADIPARSDAQADPGLLLPEIVRVTLRAGQLRLAGGNGASAIEMLAAEATLHGAIAPPFDRPAIAAWRDAGGTLEIERLVLAWPDARLEAHGSLSLDDAFRPLGALTVSTDRPQALVARLEEAGVIEAPLAARLEQAFALLPPAAGEGNSLSLPLSLQDGRLFLAGIPIAAL